MLLVINNFQSEVRGHRGSNPLSVFRRRLLSHLFDLTLSSDDYSDDENQVPSRNKRRLGYHTDKDSYYGYGVVNSSQFSHRFPARYGRRPAYARGAPTRRRPLNARRRQNLRRLLEDYYYDDYETDYYQPRRRFENL